jgi:hypothetical protein
MFWAGSDAFSLRIGVSRIKIILPIVILWLIGTAFYAYHYVVTILASPEPYDAYARNWQFQLPSLFNGSTAFSYPVIGSPNHRRSNAIQGKV